jgi:hypothetical protein
VNLSFPASLSLAAYAFYLATQAHALEIRGAATAWPPRLVDFPGAPIHDQIPRTNPDFSPPAAMFLGIGWPAHPTEWTRQMALISPVHFVYATHYPLGPAWRIAFLGTDGKQHATGIQSQVPIINKEGRTTDLLLCTLTAALPAESGVRPFPVLGLADEAACRGREMLVCGTLANAGKTRIDGFTTLTNDPGFDTTRFAYFDFHKASGKAGDCNYQGGDSGSPAFIMVGGRPVLIGTASGQDPMPRGVSRNYINFLPAYLTELDTLMEKQGYHVRRHDPAAATIDLTVSATGQLQPRRPGRVSFDTRNTSKEAAHNLALKLTFSTAPSVVAGSGWICEAASPLVWNCRRGGLASGTHASVTATWRTLADSQSLRISSVTCHDGGAPAALDTSLSLSRESTVPSP